MTKLPEPIIADPFLAGKREKSRLLDAVGVGTVDELFRAIPDAIQQQAATTLVGHGADEWDVETYFQEQAARNHPWPAGRLWLGAGAYQYPIPSPVRDLLQRTEFLTSYTPYQPEISQGTLQGLFEFQTLVANLFGLAIANASLYDGPTAVAEAVLMGLRIHKKAHTVCLSGALSDDLRAVVDTYLAHVDCTVTCTYIDSKSLCPERWPNADIYVVGYPNALGVLEDIASLRAAHPEAFLISYTPDPHALVLYREPGNLGVDVATGEGQPFGLPIGFGGPYLGLLATHTKNLRQIPGRLCGATTDEDGREGYVLTLSTREQHIRREKATSNICSNQGILTLAFTAYAASFGWQGLQALASRILHRRQQVEGWLREAGYTISDGYRFNEGFVVGEKALDLRNTLLANGFRFGMSASDLVAGAPAGLIFAAPAIASEDDMQALRKTLGQGGKKR